MRRLNSPRLRRVAPLVAVVLVAAVIAGLVIGPRGSSGRVIAAVGTGFGAGGEFHPIKPFRALDTREAQLDVAPAGRKTTEGPNAQGQYTTTLEVDVVRGLGIEGFVDADDDQVDDRVLAVSANVTVVNPTADGYVNVFAAGSAAGTTSTVNFAGSDVVPNGVIARPGAQGKIALRVVSNVPISTDLLVDVTGWFSTSAYETRGARLVTVEPARIYDSAGPQGDGAPVSGQVRVPVRGAVDIHTGDAAVPSDANIKGVVVNVTADHRVANSRSTFVSLLPNRHEGNGIPAVSHLNLKPNDVRASLGLVALADDGSVHLYLKEGQSRLIVDVVGYFVEGVDETTRDGRVWPLEVPFRALDTREETHNSRKLGPRRAEDWDFASFVSDVNVDGVKVGAQAGVLGNLTVAEPERRASWVPILSHLTVYPTPANSAEPPEISNLNFKAGQVVPNMALLRYGEQTGVRVYNHDGSTHYLFDAYAVVLSD